MDLSIDVSLESSELGKECMEENILTMYKCMKPNYAAIFGESWNFDYLSSPECKLLLGNRIYCDIGSIDSYICKYTNNFIQYIDFDNLLDAYNFIRKKLSSQKKVAFVVDDRKCIWHKATLKTNTTHVLIAICECGDGSIICYDCKPYYITQRVTLSSFIDLYKGPVVSIEEKKSGEMESFFAPIEKIETLHKSKLWSDSFMAIDIFADEIQTINFVAECRGTTENYVWNSPIFHSLEKVTLSRKRYAEYLKVVSIYSGYSQVKDYVDRMTKVVDCWERIRLLLMKAMLCSSPKKMLLSISERIHMVAESERNIYNELTKLIWESMDEQAR